MAEYIEKQAAIDEILGQPPEAHYPTWYAEQIKAIPPADVRPVVRAYLDRRDKKHFNEFYCSNCLMLHREVPTINAIPQWNFCPNCAADMRDGDAE